MFSPIKVAVVDDHPVFREGVAAALQTSKDFKLVGQGGTAGDALQLAADVKPDILLVDMMMPGDIIAAVRRITHDHPGVKVAFLTMSEDEHKVVQAMHAGAVGYILKGVNGAELAQIIREIRDGAKYVSPGLAARILLQQATGAPRPQASAPVTGLTTREGQIMREVSNGLTNKEVARVLKISEKTVKYYMTNIMQKLQARNRTEAVLILSGKARPGMGQENAGAVRQPRAEDPA